MLAKPAFSPVHFSLQLHARHTTSTLMTTATTTEEQMKQRKAVPHPWFAVSVNEKVPIVKETLGQSRLYLPAEGTIAFAVGKLSPFTQLWENH